MKSSVSWFLLLVFLAACSKKEQAPDQYLVMLSMDGFRWDYTDRVHTPNFDRIARQGIKARSLRPAFPTKTFPNHYSMATGLYPDHHGIVLNLFYDEATGRHYSISDRTTVQDGSFYGGEPIWVTAEKQGLRTGSFFWVGSEAEIGGYLPSNTKVYEEDFPYEQRIDSVISWLQKPEEERPRLILWYFDEPDHAGHAWGPDSPRVDSMIVRLDSLLGVFLNKLETIPFADRVNVIVTSDHGMGPISNERRVVLADHINMNWVRELQGFNPNFNILASENCIDSIYDALISVEGIQIWKTGALPERLHYGTHPRTLDLVVLADSSWSVVIDHADSVGAGAHGFDNADSDMHAIFYAYGPAFKKDYLAPSFDNIDIYPLICEILGLEPAAVDGTLDNVINLLERPNHSN